MLRRLYDWTLARAAGPQAEAWFAGVSFVDGALLPIPPELLQIPMAMARPSHAWRVGIIGALSSAAGAVLGYEIGALFYQGVAMPLIKMTGHLPQFEAFMRAVAGNVFLWPIAFVVMPQAAAMAAGSVPLGIGAALAASLVGRGSRFLIVAWLLRHFGARAQVFIDRYFHHVAVAVLAILAVYVVVRYAL